MINLWLIQSGNAFVERQFSLVKLMLRNSLEIPTEGDFLKVKSVYTDKDISEVSDKILELY